MPFYLYDARGYLADGPTVAGWRELRLGLTGPEGQLFARAGVTEEPLVLAREADAVVTDDPAVRASLRALARAARAAQELLILTDGVGLDV